MTDNSKKGVASKTRFRWYGYWGVASIIVSQILMFLRVEPFYSWFTPIQWTGYILFLDALLVRLRGHGYIVERTSEFIFMLVTSIAVWFLFEAYNLHLRNWYYTNLPDNFAVRIVGYFWAFSTVFPGVLLTSEALDELGFLRSLRFKAVVVSKRSLLISVVLGTLAVVVPILVPQKVAIYLFIFVWLGFVFMLDPINDRLGMPSFYRQLREGSVQKLLSLFLAGAICGVLWEFWNFWAGRKWIYTIPYFSEPKIFEMPLYGFLGFLPFAAECFVFWQILLYLRKRVLLRPANG